MSNGYNQASIDQPRERNVNVVKTLTEKTRMYKNQTQYIKIRRENIMKDTEISTEYFEREGGGESQRLIARGRCGNLEEGNKYWLEMDKRSCDLYRADEGTINHLMEICIAIPRESIRVEEVVSGKINVKVDEWL